MSGNKLQTVMHGMVAGASASNKVPGQSENDPRCHRSRFMCDPVRLKILFTAPRTTLGRPMRRPTQQRYSYDTSIYAQAYYKSLL